MTVRRRALVLPSVIRYSARFAINVCSVFVVCPEISDTVCSSRLSDSFMMSAVLASTPTW